MRENQRTGVGALELLEDLLCRCFHDRVVAEGERGLTPVDRRRKREAWPCDPLRARSIEPCKNAPRALHGAFEPIRHTEGRQGIGSHGTTDDVGTFTLTAARPYEERE